MIKRHLNPTQVVPSPTGFLPLMRNEVPYFDNLNRPALSAYNYVDLVNAYTSYGGNLSILQPGVDQTFSLYDIVMISDEEFIMPALSDSPINSRFGIVVVEATIDPVTQLSSNIVILTFCSNFVYPDSSASSYWQASVGSPLYLNSNSSNAGFLSGVPTSTFPTEIGFAPIAMKIGRAHV